MSAYSSIFKLLVAFNFICAAPLLQDCAPPTPSCSPPLFLTPTISVSFFVHFAFGFCISFSCCCCNSCAFFGRCFNCCWQRNFQRNIRVMFRSSQFMEVHLNSCCPKKRKKKKYWLNNRCNFHGLTWPKTGN